MQSLLAYVCQNQNDDLDWSDADQFCDCSDGVGRLETLAITTLGLPMMIQFRSPTVGRVNESKHGPINIGHMIMNRNPVARQRFSACTEVCIFHDFRNNQSGNF